MLARGVGRLVGDVTKTSTHDLSRLSNALRNNLFSRNGLSLPIVRDFSRVYKATVIQDHRSYATTTRETKPTTKVKKDVKKAARKRTKKAAAPQRKKKAVATQKTAASQKGAAKKKAKPKKRVAAKAARKRAKKVVTSEEKEKLAIKKLKDAALKGPNPGRRLSPYSVFTAEAVKGSKDISIATASKDIAAKFKALTPAEREHLNHRTNERGAREHAEYVAWIRTHTPDQIRVANNARLLLKRKAATGAKVRILRRNLVRLQDDRQVKRPIIPYIRFFKERHLSGDFKGIERTKVAKLAAEEWKALSASEKQKYLDEYDVDRVAYEAERKKTDGQAVEETA